MAAGREGGPPGAGARISLFLRIWPHLASRPSVPIGPPCRRCIPPGSGEPASQGLAGGRARREEHGLFDMIEGSGCPGESPRVHLQMTGGPIPTWVCGKAAFAHFHPRTGRAGTGRPAGIPSPLWGLQEAFNSEKAPPGETQLSPRLPPPHLCRCAVWFSFVRREGHYL